MPHLHRIVYCSRSRLTGSADDKAAALRQILARSRANNAGREIGGALLYTHDCFAQVLEGPRTAVSQVFERIQRDPRHGDVVVLLNEPANTRHFPGWAMAEAQIDPADGRTAQRELSEAFAGRTTAPGRTLLDLLRQALDQQMAV